MKHGHVTPNPNGIKARCGGPALCKVCALELSELKSTKEGQMEQEPMMQFFSYSHLPEKMQAVSKPFGDLAQSIVDTTPRNPERTAALRKLLEAKDCAVRALIYK